MNDYHQNFETSLSFLLDNIKKCQIFDEFILWKLTFFDILNAFEYKKDKKNHNYELYLSHEFKYLYLFKLEYLADADIL